MGRTLNETLKALTAARRRKIEARAAELIADEAEERILLGSGGGVTKSEGTAGALYSKPRGQNTNISRKHMK